MPSKHYSEKFKMDIDDYDLSNDRPDEDFREEMHDFKLEKLSHRVTLITILIPILIAVIIVVSYLDIKQKVVQTQTTGTLGVQNLSKDLESRFSSLSVRQAKLEDEIKKRVESFDNNWGEYAVQKKKIEDKIADLSKRTAEKKELSEAIKRFNNVFDNLKEEIAVEHKALEAIKKSATQSLNQVTDLNEKTQEKFETLSQATEQTSELVEKKLDKNQLDLALKIRDLKLREQFQQQTKELEKELTQLKQKTDKLSDDLSAALNKIKEISKIQPKQEPKPKSTSAKSNPPSPPKKGKIVEQDLN